MNTTINYNIVDDVCEGTDSVTITSTLITDYVAALPTPDHTLDLKITYLTGDEITVAINDSNANLDTINNEYDLTPDDADMTDSLSDGVYLLKLVKTVTATGSTTTEFKCLFVDCKTSCKVRTYNVENEDAMAGVLYSILTVQDNCTKCNCTTNVKIYNKLVELLNKIDNCEC